MEMIPGTGMMPVPVDMHIIHGKNPSVSKPVVYKNGIRLCTPIAANADTKGSMPKTMHDHPPMHAKKV